MVAAFAYWDLRVDHGWPAPLALLAVIGVGAPLLGALLGRFLVRPLRGASVEVTLVVTLGLLLALLSLAFVVWDPSQGRRLPGFFDGKTVRVVDLVVSFHQITVVVAAALVAVALRTILYRSRTGLAMRAVVDDPDLLALNAAEPVLVTAASWALGARLAALAGVLIAPLVSLDAITLTLLVVNAYAAALLGRLRSLPMTFLGGILLGLAVSYATGYLPQDETWDRLAAGLPTIALFAVLLFLPSARVASAHLTQRRVPPLPAGRTVWWGAAGAMAVVVGVSRAADLSDLANLSDVLGIGVILLSLVLLTGYGGQVSLCQLSFAGVGALVVGKLGANPAGMLAAVGLSAAVGALVALPAIRLRGLYLALATLAFARFMDVVVFPNDAVLGAGERLDVERLHLGPLRFASDRAYLVLLGAAFVGTALLLVRIRASAFGRRLAAMGDSPVACGTVGMSVTSAKLAVFAISAGLAGLGGALAGGYRGGVSAADYTMLGSLSQVMLVVLGGVGHVAGALLGSATLALIGVAKPHVSDTLQRVLDLGPGIVVMLVLARVPDGVGGWLGRTTGGLRGRWAEIRRGPVGREPVLGEGAVA
jgi:branched-chain amino acid transport system permease protein